MASDAASSDSFGYSLSLSGDTAVVGAYLDNNAGGTDAGSAYVFVRNGASWSEQSKLVVSDAANDSFGNSVSISGNTAVVGAITDDNDGGVDAGSAYSYCLTPQASASHRNAGSNPDSYSANAPTLGGTFIGTVDLTTTGHDFALLFGFGSPVTQTLEGGQVLLCSPIRGGGKLLSRSANPGPIALILGGDELLHQSAKPGPIAVFTVAVPNDLSLCGLSLCTQALHFGGGTPFALSNAQDLVFGY